MPNVVTLISRESFSSYLNSQCKPSYWDLIVLALITWLSRTDQRWKTMPLVMVASLTMKTLHLCSTYQQSLHRSPLFSMFEVMCIDGLTSLAEIVHGAMAHGWRYSLPGSMYLWAYAASVISTIHFLYLVLGPDGWFNAHVSLDFSMTALLCLEANLELLKVRVSDKHA